LVDIYFLTNCNRTSSEDVRTTLPKILLADSTERLFGRRDDYRDGLVISRAVCD